MPEVGSGFVLTILLTRKRRVLRGKGIGNEGSRILRREGSSTIERDIKKCGEGKMSGGILVNEGKNVGLRKGWGNKVL